MIKRHTQEYQLLYNRVEAHIQSLKDRAESSKQAAEAVLMVEQAKNATVLIQTVSEQGVSPIAKEKVIQAFSPRSKKGSPRSRLSPGRSSRGSNRSAGSAGSGSSQGT
jgi:hypothetical protein